MKMFGTTLSGIALGLAACTGFALAAPSPASAQSNNNDYTPLNSRIRRDRQFPTSMINPYRGEVGSATRKRSRQMLGVFNRCIYNRSKSGAVEFLAETDYGLMDFAQLDLENDRAARIYGFQDCLRRVAQQFNTGASLTFSAFGLRRWFIEQAYLDRYPEGPEWLRADYVIGPRDFPLSAQNQPVHVAMNLADCMVAANPFAADFLFRTEPNSEDEARAIEALVPSLQPCLPAGQRIEITPDILRVWVGEGLWHASQHSAPAPDEEEQ